MAKSFPAQGGTRGAPGAWEMPHECLVISQVPAQCQFPLELIKWHGGLGTDVK